MGPLSYMRSVVDRNFVCGAYLYKSSDDTENMLITSSDSLMIQNFISFCLQILQAAIV